MMKFEDIKAGDRYRVDYHHTDTYKVICYIVAKELKEDFWIIDYYREGSPVGTRHVTTKLYYQSDLLCEMFPYPSIGEMVEL